MTKTWMVGAVVVALAVGGAVIAKVSGPSEVREIQLVAKDMTYFVAQSTAGNPTIRLQRGEKVRLVLTNDDPGYSHNVVVPVLGISTPLLQHGGSQSVEFRVPDVTGVFPYECSPHSEMMRGTIAIE